MVAIITLVAFKVSCGGARTTLEVSRDALTVGRIGGSLVIAMCSFLGSWFATLRHEEGLTVNMV